MAAFVTAALPLPRFVAYYASTGAPLAAGKVFQYVPGTTTLKTSWQDSAMSIPNQNPLTLDSGGSALIYGAGAYSLAVFDSLGNAVPAYSGLTTSTDLDLVNLTLNGIVTFNGATVYNGATDYFGAANFHASPAFIAPIFGNTNFSGTVTVNGVASTSVAGWQYAGTGPAAHGLAVVNIAVTAAGSSMLANNFFAVSDARLKLDVETISEADALQWLTRSRPVSYRKLLTYAADPATAAPECGFLAQEQVTAGYGRYVGTAPCEGLPERVDGDMTSLADVMLTLSPQYQVAYLTRALQVAMARIKALEARI
jgi:hypothetical protein